MYNYSYLSKNLDYLPNKSLGKGKGGEKEEEEEKEEELLPKFEMCSIKFCIQN